MMQMRESGFGVGRFKIRRLMQEAGLVCKQLRPPANRQATVERPDIPNRLNRQFTVSAPNQVWCGDITYVWVQNRWRSCQPCWICMPVVLPDRHCLSGPMWHWSSEH